MPGGHAVFVVVGPVRGEGLPIGAWHGGRNREAQDSCGRPDPYYQTGSSFAPITGLAPFVRRRLRLVNGQRLGRRPVLVELRIMLGISQSMSKNENTPCRLERRLHTNERAHRGAIGSCLNRLNLMASLLERRYVSAVPVLNAR